VRLDSAWSKRGANKEQGLSARSRERQKKIGPFILYVVARLHTLDAL
jgi:hypothetical protein